MDLEKQIYSKIYILLHTWAIPSKSTQPSIQVHGGKSTNNCGMSSRFIQVMNNFTLDRTVHKSNY
jgi:hypothetical protein